MPMRIVFTGSTLIFVLVALDLHMPVTSDMMGQLLKKDYPQVEQYTRHLILFNGG